MGKRSVRVLESAAWGITEASWFIESQGLASTAERFSNAVYDFIETFLMIGFPTQYAGNLNGRCLVLNAYSLKSTRFFLMTPQMKFL